MLDFIRAYWRYILEAIVLLASLIIFIVRKRPSSSLLDTIMTELQQSLPYFIVSVEHPGDGQSKLSRVVNMGLSFVSKKLGRSLSDDEISFWTTWISNTVEMILICPQKKEDSK